MPENDTPGVYGEDGADLSVLENIVASFVAYGLKYGKSLSSGLLERELLGVAWEAANRALQKYDPARGARKAYIKRCVWNALRNYVTRERRFMGGKEIPIEHGEP